MRAKSAASRLPFRAAHLFAAVVTLVLSGCDAADPHVPAVVRAPASALSPSPSSAQAAAQAQNGLAPPVMHRVD